MHLLWRLCFERLISGEHPGRRSALQGLFELANEMNLTPIVGKAPERYGKVQAKFSGGMFNPQLAFNSG